MAQQTRLTWYYCFALIGTLTIFTLAYNFGMSTFEGQSQSLVRSLQVVTQTFTTVGYGEDAPYATDVMNLLAITMQASGIALIFAALPVFVIPLIEDALASAPPTSVADRSDHVILCTYTARGKALVAELDRRDAAYVVIEPDRETATTLHEGDVPVVYGDPEAIETLENAGIADAMAVVADASDEVNASIVLAAQEAAEDVQTISIVNDPALSEYHRYAGADRTVSPRQLLGQRLGKKVTTTPTMDLDDVIELDEAFDIAELPVGAGSPLAGRTLAESRLGRETGAVVLGAWLGGRFVSPVPLEAVLDDQTVLLAVGREAQLDWLRELIRSGRRQSHPGWERDHGFDRNQDHEGGSEGNYDHGRDRDPYRVVVAGFGVVGRAVVDTLAEADVQPTVLDTDAGPDVDVACDATDPGALREAAIGEARTVIIALANDTEAVFATLIIRELDPEVEIVARANETDSVAKLYRAGADYVLDLATVSGRMVATELLSDAAAGSLDEGTTIVRTNAPGLAGRTLAETDVRNHTGATIIAVEREGEILTGIDPSFTVQADDSVIVTGTDEAIAEFESIAN